MLKSFIKYHSLGNDFVIFDWYKKPTSFMQTELSAPSMASLVKATCDRHTGVGADGLLVIISSAQASMPEMIVFNADGSRAETCFNGLRCVAHHLFVNHKFPKQFSIKTGQRVAECSVVPHVQGIQIVTRIGAVSVDGQRTVTTSAGDFTGYVANVGNPHFIIFAPTDLDWLAQHGAGIESHPSFEHKTNVEFVVPISGAQNTTGLSLAYSALVYERGCGITLACSSGAAAVTGLLCHLGQIACEQKIAIVMPGGMVQAWVDKNNEVTLQATAHSVFEGSFVDDQPGPLLYHQHSQGL